MHTPKNTLSLQEMYAIAYLIESSEKKIKGFNTNPEAYIKKKENRI